MAERHRIGHGFGHGVKYQRAMRVNNAFGVARGAGSETHRSAVIFIEGGIFEFSGGAGEQIFVVESAGRNRAAAVRHDDDLFECRVVAEFIEQRDRDIVDDQKTILSLTGNGGDFVRMESQIQRMKDRAGGRHAEEGFEVCILIPEHRSDAIAALYAKLRESFGEAARSIVEDAIAGADERAVGSARNDFNIGEEFAGALEERGEQERVVHHGPVHVTPLGKSRPAADTTTFDVRWRDLACGASG